MKRRALSLFMALALCLSLLPAPLLAVETGAALGADGGTDDAYAIGEDAAAPEDGVAPLANEAGVVSVTVNGETTEYSDIIEAFESVGKTGSATVKLLDDAYLRENKERPTFPGKIELMNNVNITLDLDGHTITHADTGYTGWKTASRSRASLPTAKRNSTVSNIQTKPAPSQSTAAR